MAALEVKNEELRTVREATREMSSILRLLERGDLDKVVLTSKGRMVGVVVTPETYARLLATP